MSFEDFSSLLIVGLSVFDTLPFIGAGLGMGPFLLVVVSYSLVWCFGKGAYGTFNMRIRIYTSTEWEDGMGFDSLRVIACTATTITIDIWIYLFTSIHLYLRTHNLHYHVNNSLSLSPSQLPPVFPFSEWQCCRFTNFFFLTPVGMLHVPQHDAVSLHAFPFPSPPSRAPIALL